ASRDPDARHIALDFRAARQRLARALLSPGPDPAAHARRVASLTEDKEELERRLSRRLRLAAPARAAAPAPHELSKALPADAAFVDLFRYFDFEPDPKVPGKKGWHHTPRYAAFVLGRGKGPARVELGEAAPVEAAWAAWRRAIVAGRDDRKEAGE